MVHDLHIAGGGFSPTEAQAPLVIDPDAILPLAIPFLHLEFPIYPLRILPALTTTIATNGTTSPIKVTTINNSPSRL